MEDVKQTREEEDDELKPEYDLRSLRVRKLGPGRKRFGQTSIEALNIELTNLAEIFRHVVVDEEMPTIKAAQYF
ncbi:MAG TPA: hypothetical protein DC054_15620 [Blastocatellia bacterium]|nr:hypothetical protein [Blastocatellia bacterium]